MLPDYAGPLAGVAAVARIDGWTFQYLTRWTVVVGIAPDVAMTLVRLGVRIPLTQTALDLEEGLEWLGT